MKSRREKCSQGDRRASGLCNCLHHVCQGQRSGATSAMTELPTSSGPRTLSLQTETSANTALARTRASAETASGAIRAPAWKGTKAKTVNCVSSFSCCAFASGSPEGSGARGEAEAPREAVSGPVRVGSGFPHAAPV